MIAINVPTVHFAQVPDVAYSEIHVDAYAVTPPFCRINRSGVPLRQRVSAYSAGSFFNISTALVFLGFSSSDFL